MNLIQQKKSCVPIYIGLDKEFFERNFFYIFLTISFNICFWYLKEPSHWDGSFDYPQHMFWMRNKKVNVLVRTLKFRACMI